MLSAKDKAGRVVKEMTKSINERCQFLESKASALGV